MSRKHRVFVDGRVHVRAAQCSTCIFGPRSPVSVERRESMVLACGDEGVIPCHHHLLDKQRIEPVCRGFYDRNVNVILRLARALDRITWVRARER